MVAFFAVFLCCIRASIRKSGGCDEALAWRSARQRDQLRSMVMASQVGETAALRLHATELLMLLGTASCCWSNVRAAAAIGVLGELSLQQPQFRDDRAASLTAWLAAGTPQ